MGNICEIQVTGEIGISCNSTAVNVGGKPFYIQCAFQLIETVNLLAEIGIHLTALLTIEVAINEFMLVNNR